MEWGDGRKGEIKLESSDLLASVFYLLSQALGEMIPGYTIQHPYQLLSPDFSYRQYFTYSFHIKYSLRLSLPRTTVKSCLLLPLRVPSDPEIESAQWCLSALIFMYIR